ncbi:hypothetical protein BGW80DRAFT_1565637 [Lactifluus volemus]|nr:hypothetical protein BGW80DRAFT_1565637 [Lactifluus volemus]
MTFKVTSTGNQQFQYIVPQSPGPAGPIMPVPLSPSAVRDSIATIIPTSRSLGHDRRQSIESALSGADETTPRSRNPSAAPATHDDASPPPRAPPLPLPLDVPYSLLLQSSFSMPGLQCLGHSEVVYLISMVLACSPMLKALPHGRSPIVSGLQPMQRYLKRRTPSSATATATACGGGLRLLCSLIAVANGSAEGEERTRCTVRSRLGSREIFKHAARPSLDDLLSHIKHHTVGLPLTLASGRIPRPRRHRSNCSWPVIAALSKEGGAE